jgi:hypothetical protein
LIALVALNFRVSIPPKQIMAQHRLQERKTGHFRVRFRVQNVVQTLVGRNLLSRTTIGAKQLVDV